MKSTYKKFLIISLIVFGIVQLFTNLIFLYYIWFFEGIDVSIVGFIIMNWIINFLISIVVFISFLRKTYLVYKYVHILLSSALLLYSLLVTSNVARLILESIFSCLSLHGIQAPRCL